MAKKKCSLFFDKKSQNRLFYSLIIGIILIGVLSLYFVSAPSFNPQDNRTIGYEFLNLSGNIVNSSLGEVVHIWNTQDDYYFNKSSGIQFTNHFEDYWTKNIFCIGYYSGEEWIKIKCADELSNFNKIIETDNLTYVNATLWKDITYSGYDMRLGINYYLGLNDQNLSITIYGKNIGVDIPFDLGFAWKVADWNIPPNITNDNILINNTSYLLNGTYNILFKNMNESYFKGYDNDFWGEKFLRINWNKSLNYTVKMYGDGNQSNFSIALLINAGHFDSQQEKSTTFYWIDALTLGNNSGFVTTAPTADPNGETVYIISDKAIVFKDTSPATAIKITKIGWWADAATEAANFEVGLYAADGATVPGEAGTLLEVSRTNAKGTTAGWKVVTVNWNISANTAYWIGVQLDDIPTATNTDRATLGGAGYDRKTLQTTLTDPFGGGALTDADGLISFYAVWEAADTIYPNFSSFWDDNATLVGSGTGKFNVTVENTNGTVLLEINNTNITARNLTSNVYNATYNFTGSGTYTYRWHSWGNGTNKNYNKSTDRSYTVNVSSQNNYSRNVSQNLITTTSINRIGNLKKNIIGTFSMGNLINRISKPLRGLTQTFQVSNIVNRIYISLRTTIQNLNINTFISKITLSLKSIVQSLNINLITGTLRDTFGTIIQVINVNDFISRLTLSLKSLFQSLNINTLTSRIYSTITSLTQSLNIDTFVNRIFISLRTPIQSLNLDTFISRLTLSLKSIIQSLNLNLITGTLRDTFGTIIQAINVNDFISRLTLSLKSITQPFNINIFISKSYSTITSLIQSINLDTFTSRLFASLRTPLQSLKIDIIINRLTLSFRNIFQQINLDIFTSKIYSTITSISQNLQIGNIINRIFIALRTPIQNLNIDSIILRLTLSLKSIIQSLNINTFISRVYSTMTSLIQSLNIDVIVNRIFLPIRDLFQNIKINTVVNKFILGFRNIFQFLNTSLFIDKLREVPTTIYQGIDLFSMTERMGNLFKNIPQPLNIDLVLNKIYAAITSVSQNINFSDIVNRIYNQIRTITQNIQLNSIVNRLISIIRNIFQNLLITIIKVRDVIGGITPTGEGGIGFPPTNETRICIDVYYFIIENMDNKGELVYTKDDLNNLTTKISEVRIVNTAQAINYIDNYDELCENLTGLKIPKKKLPLPTIWANFTIFKGERLTCSPIINQTFLLINFDKAISCWWSDCGVNVGSIECNTLDFYRWLAKFEKQGDNYTLTGIKLYLIIIIVFIGSIISTLLIKSKLKRLEKGKKVHNNFLMIGILLLLIFMGIFIFLNVLSFVQNERPKCLTSINQDFLGFIDLDSSLNCWWNEGNCGINVGYLECNSLDFWRFIFHYKQSGDNYLLNGVKIWWVISLFIIGGIVSGLLIRKRVKNLEKNHEKEKR